MGSDRSDSVLFIVFCRKVGSDCYTEAEERSTTDGGDDNARGFPHSAHCCITLQPSLVCVSEFKALVTSKVYHLVVTTVSLKHL
jgi:hypothetical protein